MILLLQRIVITIVIIGVVYFLLHKVWTRDIDLVAYLKKPAEAIPEKKKTAFSIPETSGILLPRDKNDPPEHTAVPKGAVALFLGTSLAYTKSFPHTVIEVGGDPGLVIDKNERGIGVFAKLFSEDGRIVAELRDNRFYVNPNNYFRIERPDDHTLLVYDQGGNQALSVEFLSPSAIKLLGRFHFPHRQPIIIEEAQLLYGGMKFSNFTFGGNSVDIAIP